ncbi:2Fe-2S iron-sulfur cluster-binding protein [Streptomyces sp. NPDC091217]|uniref:2Fe-2S iron-sulfur cluster-binding protein n=1 Tax=Streptomyces sp. NPDC091217 TaxID=3365975 RepID=UPI0037F457E5
MRCTSVGLLRDVRQAWQQEGRPPADPRFETFGNEWEPSCPAVLDALQEAGAEIMYDCLRGERGLCRVRVLESDGRIDHRDVFLSSRERTQGRQMCACVSPIARRRVTIDC